MLTTELFDHAYWPNWFDQLDALASLAMPEPWRFKADTYVRKNTRTPVLEKYSHSVFRCLSIDYQNARSAAEADAAIMIRGEYSCYNTGLLSRNMQPIYAYFERNKREWVAQDWYFKGWLTDSSPNMARFQTLPQKPFYNVQHDVVAYFAELPIRVNVEHILQTPDNLERIPAPIRAFKNLSLLLETGIEMMRRLAAIMPSIIVSQLYQGCIQFLAPVYLSDPEAPDIAMTLAYMDGFYQCRTCLTPQMAYSNARLLARPTAPWLVALVE